MRSMNGAKIPVLLLYALGWLLLWEWLRPLSELANVGSISIFVVFIAISLLMYALSPKGWWRWLVLPVYILWAIRYVYYPDVPLTDAEWLFEALTETVLSFYAIAGGEWMEITNAFRTILLFALLWMVTYLLHYWLMVRKRIFLFFFMTIIFLAVLDTFTPYSADFAIIRLFVIGFLLLGILRMERMLQFERLVIKPQQYMKWLIPFLVFLLISGMIGYFSPKYAAQWSDPVPFIVSTSEKFSGGGSGGTGKVGYDEDDTSLGGGFTEDDTLVMTAKVQTRHYWKIESKDIYTGKGWLDSGGNETEANRQLRIGEMNLSPSVNTTALQEGSLDFESPSDYVPYPTPGAEGLVTGKEPDTAFTYDGTTGKIESDGRTGFTYQYKVPIYNIDELKTVKNHQAETVDSRYLQLPEYLPGRVRELASTLTENQDNWYDKVKAIEDYFDSPQFAYERTDIPYPRDDQDFVDQFLFETKIGYCDHYSTSMVVMVRSLGIPARWVKGYTHGTFTGREDGKNIYEVTNNNAHSWVEVYFPETGWVPFEPTKGFTNNNRFEYNNSESGQDEPEEAEEEQNELPENTPEKPEPPQPEQNAGNEDSFAESAQKTIEEHKWTIVLIAALLILAAALSYAARGKWLPRLWLLYFRSGNDPGRMEKAYEVLLKQMARYGIKRKSDQTLRDYSRYIDEYFRTSDMSKLTREYERILYNQEDASAYWEKSKPLWEKMMRKTIT